MRLAILVFAIALLAACGAPREASLPAGSPVLIIGDSITAGLGVDAVDAWPAQLAQRTGWNVVAAGVSGDRSAGGRARLPALLEETSPALVIIELGGNDMLARLPDADITANLEAMIADVRKRGAKVVLMAVPQVSALGAVTGLSPASLYLDLAKRHKVPLIEKALPGVLSDSSLKMDAIHPNKQGHRVLAERAREELARMGFAPAS